MTTVQSPRQSTFKIEGMDCAGCAATLTRAMEGLPGVAHPEVSLQRELLTLEMDDTPANLERLRSTVRSLGFAIVMPEEEAKEASPRAWWNTPKTRHLGLSVLLSILALVAGAVFPQASQVLLTGVAAFAIFPIARRALNAARLGSVFTIQMLMTIAAVGAVIIGEQLEALIVVLLFMVGEFLEGLAAEKARSGIKALGALLPQEARVVHGDHTHVVPAASLRIGQTVLVRPGDRLPADGEISAGLSSLDESPVTGESVPVTKGVGDPVFAGSVNFDAALHVNVTKAAEDNTIARILRMVEEAQDSKAPTERFIERFSRVYMPFVIGVAVLVAIIPPLLGMGEWLTWTYRALALLLIGCPCALVISVPAAIAASLAAGARHGILVKGGAVMEEIARASAVVFDKTGTLTEGKPRVTDLLAWDMPEADLLALAFGVEQGSAHPLAEAICREAEARGVAAQAVQDIRVVPGKGMEARQDGQRVFVGAPRFAVEEAGLSNHQAVISALEASGKTVAVVVRDGQALGAIALRDEPRETTRAGLERLSGQGVSAVMMTGDNQRTAEAIGADLKIEVAAEMLPEDKAARVRALSAGQTVMMVGDGVNDAPALAEAHVGIAIGSGTDVAMEASNAALMRNDIGDVARMVDLARGTMSNVRQNVAIALGLKAVFLVTTVTGISGLWMAVLADTGATVLVTLNAMRLLGYLGPARRTDQAPEPLLGTMEPSQP